MAPKKIFKKLIPFGPFESYDSSVFYCWALLDVWCWKALYGWTSLAYCRHKITLLTKPTWWCALTVKGGVEFFATVKLEGKILTIIQPYESMMPGCLPLIFCVWDRFLIYAPMQLHTGALVSGLHSFFRYLLYSCFGSVLGFYFFLLPHYNHHITLFCLLTFMFRIHLVAITSFPLAALLCSELFR